MKHATILRLATLVLAGLSVASCGPIVSLGPLSPSTQVFVTPSFLTLAVGQTSRLTATTSATDQAVRFTLGSSYPSGAITVSPAGDVHCDAEGNGDVTATSAVDLLAFGKADIFCAAPGRFVRPGAVNFVHAPTTSCPDTIATISLTNPYDTAFTVTSTSTGLPSIIVVGLPVSVAPHKWTTATLVFNCSTDLPFSGTVNFKAVSPTATYENAVTVTRQ